MSKKDYQLLAGAFGAALRSITPDTLGAMVKLSGVWIAVGEVARVLALGNERFDEAKFRQSITKAATS